MKIKVILGVFLMILSLTSCDSSGRKGTNNGSISLKDQNDSVAYAMGMGLSAQYSYFNGDDYRPEPMEMAVNDFINEKDFRLTDDQKNELIKTYFKAVKTFKQDSILRRSKVWLEKNRNKEGVIVTPRGLQYKYLKEGGSAGISPDGNDIVLVNYVQGSVYRGQLWDQSMATNSRDTIKLALNRELSGFSEGMQLMRVGDKIKMWLPPEIGSAEGKDPAQVAIKNEVIYIEVELLGVQDRKTSLIEIGEKSQAPGYFINEDERND